MAAYPLLFVCLLVAAPWPGSVAKKPLSPAPLDPEGLEDVCDLVQLVQAMYCYCDFLGRGEAETGNCLVYNTTRDSDAVWDTFYHQPNLHQLTVSVRGDGALDFVPTRALTYLRRLWRLEIKNAGIARVKPDAFGRSTSLSDLVLARSGIQELARHAFRDLSNVTRINLGENQVRVVGRHVFQHLPRLRQLYLDRNRITRLRNGAFAELGALRELELYGNALRAVSRGTFKGLAGLERLDLHRNQLAVIGDRTFAELPALRDLDLSENSIKYISDHGLEGLARLQRLTLHDNQLASLQPETFQHTPQLFYLNLQRNRLRTLSSAAFAPILDNMRNITMYFYVNENRLRCDCGLAWVVRLHSQTASAHVKAAIDATSCFMEKSDGTEKPERQDSEPDPDSEDDTKPDMAAAVKLTALKVSELPCDRPLAEEPVTEPAVMEQEPREKEPPSMKDQPEVGEEPLVKEEVVSKEESEQQQTVPQRERQKVAPLSDAPQPARVAQETPPPPAADPAEVKDAGSGGARLAVSTALLLLAAGAPAAG